MSRFTGLGTKCIQDVNESVSLPHPLYGGIICLIIFYHPLRLLPELELYHVPCTNQKYFCQLCTA